MEVVSSCAVKVYIHHIYLIGKGGYVFGSISLSICLFVCGQHYSKSYEWIGVKFYGEVLDSTMMH